MVVVCVLQMQTPGCVYMSNNHIVYAYFRDIGKCNFIILTEFDFFLVGLQSGDGDVEDPDWVRLIGDPGYGDGCIDYEKCGEQQEYFQWHGSWFEQL